MVPATISLDRILQRYDSSRFIQLMVSQSHIELTRQVRCSFRIRDNPVRFAICPGDVSVQARRMATPTSTSVQPAKTN